MEKYEFLNRTGEGAYGSVWKARDKNTGILVAVKKMKDVPTTEEEGEIAMREVRVLQLAKHVNIVNLLEAYKSQSGRLYLVFEYVERTLLQELKANRGGMEHPVIKSLMWQLVQAIGYLHRKQIIHRDVKPSNILITEGGVVKICDFGFARACSNTSSNPAYTTYVVTRWYRPPEVLVGDTYGPPVDIWALGCIFAEMLMGRPLFPGKNHHDQLWLIIKCLGRMTERQLDLLDSDPQFACFRLPTQSEIEQLEHRLEGVSPAAMQVLRACLDPDPKYRASAEELLAMPYFHGVTEVLPLEDLSAYPDPDMRARLNRAMAQDQATAAAAVAAREAALLPSGNQRMLAPPGKAQQQAPSAASSTSPPRLALQQLPHQPQQLPGGQVLPYKSATSSKLEPCAEPQRPPLQRHITAPAGTMVARVNAQPPVLQPLTEHCTLQPQRTGSETSQQSSPKGLGGGASGVPSANGAVNTGPLVLPPPRGRPSWRVSGDGSAEPAAASVLGARPACSAAIVVPQQPMNAPAQPVSSGSALPETGRATFDGSSATTRPPSRVTWNGCAPRSQTVCGSTGGASMAGGYSGSTGSAGCAANGGTAGCGPSAGQSSLASSFQYHQPLPFDTVAVQRKAHSLAGNEALPPGSGSAPMGIRGTGGLMGVQGRSLAPQLGPGTGNGSSSAPAAAGFQLPPSQLFLPSATAAHRMALSPLPGGYSHLRGNNAAACPMPGPSGATQGRTSQDGTGSVACTHSVPVPAAAAAAAAPAAVAPTPLFQTKQPLVGPAAPCMNGPMAASLLDVEASESSVADAAASAHHNEGRRASDTVIFAMTSRKEAKYRAEKASHMNAAAVRPQHGGLLLEGVAVAHGGAVGSGNGSSSSSSGGGAQGPGTTRTSSLTRGSTQTGNGPPSPDASAPPSNLPPLQATPLQRRVSAPEGFNMAVLAPAHVHGGLGAGGGGGGGSNAGSRVSSAASNGGGGCGCLPQRAPFKPHQGYQLQGLQGYASAASGSGGYVQQTHGVEVNCLDGSGGPHAFLPVLDIGGSTGKAAVRGGASCLTLAVGVARRPSKGSMRVTGPDANSKREEAAKGVLLEAVPEAGVL